MIKENKMNFLKILAIVTPIIFLINQSFYGLCMKSRCIIAAIENGRFIVFSLFVSWLLYHRIKNGYWG